MTAWHFITSFEDDSDDGACFMGLDDRTLGTLLRVEHLNQKGGKIALSSVTLGD